MGWWPFGPKGDITAKKLPEQSSQPAQELQIKKQLGSENELAEQLPRPSSIFEFGEPVPVGGDILKGMCAGSDPDAIHACTWTIEQAQGKGREKKPRYRVEF